MSRKAEDLTGIDPVRILDLVGVDTIDLRPEVRVAEVVLREIPEGIAAFDGMGGGVAPRVLRESCRAGGDRDEGGGAERPPETGNIHALDGCCADQAGAWETAGPAAGGGGR